MLSIVGLLFLCLIVQDKAQSGASSYSPRGRLNCLCVFVVSRGLGIISVDVFVRVHCYHGIVCACLV